MSMVIQVIVWENTIKTEWYLLVDKYFSLYLIDKGRVFIYYLLIWLFIRKSKKIAINRQK